MKVETVNRVDESHYEIISGFEAELESPKITRCGSPRFLSFTLIELLMVIFIIGLLSALVMPALSLAKNSARGTQCKSNLRGIGQALTIYTVNYQGFLPIAAQMPTVNTDYPRIRDVMSDYLDTGDVFKCPADDKEYFTNEGSSYAYKMSYGGRRVKDILKRRLGINSFIMYDYEPFHGKPGTKSAANYLFLDGRVADLVD